VEDYELEKQLAKCSFKKERGGEIFTSAFIIETTGNYAGQFPGLKPYDTDGVEKIDDQSEEPELELSSPLAPVTEAVATAGGAFSG
jgi:hypothetical protein